jgi:hypothetical protein
MTLTIIGSLALLIFLLLGIGMSLRCACYFLRLQYQGVLQQIAMNKGLYHCDTLPSKMLVHSTSAENLLLQENGYPHIPESKCQCGTCRPVDYINDPGSVRMILCANCGNKRCPRASDHRKACTGSNDPGQV